MGKEGGKMPLDLWGMQKILTRAHPEWGIAKVLFAAWLLWTTYKKLIKKENYIPYYHGYVLMDESVKSKLWFDPRSKVYGLVEENKVQISDDGSIFTSLEL